MVLRHLIPRLGCLAAVFVDVSLGCGPVPLPAAKTPPLPVSVIQAVVGKILDFDNYEGRIGVAKTVEVRARVRGHMTKVHFQAGAVVKEGKLLYEY